MNILFVGETWSGSSARSMREALAALPGVMMDDVGEDHFFPKGRSPLLRASNLLLQPLHRAELVAQMTSKLDVLRPEVLIVYKGMHVPSATIRQARNAGVFTVNVFPDYSPHAHGPGLKAAMGEYNLVVTTKPFHPTGWGPIYGYSNACVCVPHGYDPSVHYWPDLPLEQDIDIVLAATWRPQYQWLMQELTTALAGSSLSIGIAGSGWSQRSHGMPSSWQVSPPLVGRSYGEWLRRGRIVIAPVHRESLGSPHPGDEDTTRTYELAAMGSFFLHRRTPFVQTLYDEASEVPMWDDVEELATLVRQYLPMAVERRDMAARAHARAVPAYSIPNRARQVLEQIRTHMASASGAAA